MKNDCQSCDRQFVCGTLAECFLNREEFQQVSRVLKQQIKKARSVKQALQALKMIKFYGKNKQKRVHR